MVDQSNEIIVISEDSVLAAIRKSKNNKKPGDDGLLNEMLKRGAPVLIEPLRMLVQFVYDAVSSPHNGK